MFSSLRSRASTFFKLMGFLMKQMLVDLAVACHNMGASTRWYVRKDRKLSYLYARITNPILGMQKNMQTTRLLLCSNAFFMYRYVKNEANSGTIICSIMMLVYIFFNTSVSLDHMWLDAMSRIKRARGAGPLLESHRDEVCWRKSRSAHSDGLLAAFFRNVANIQHSPLNYVSCSLCSFTNNN